MSLVRYSLPGDEPPGYSSSTVPYAQSTTDGSSWSPVYSPSAPSPSYYADPTATTSSTSYTPYPTSASSWTPYDIPVTSSFDSSPPSTSRSGSAAVPTLFRISTSDGYLSTLSSLSPFLTSSTAPVPVQASSISGTNRTALIAALTAGLSALLLLLLVAFLLYRRRRRRRDQRLEPPIDSRSLPHSALLYDDEMAHNTHLRMAPATMVQYQNSVVDGAAAAAAIDRPASPSLSILRTRISESGSIFREEVWPPPSPTIDPIQMRSSQVDLSRIVDDVMGPVYDQNSGEPSSAGRKGHKRELTANSTTPLLVDRLSSTGHDSSEEDLTHVYASHSPLYSPTSPISPPIVDQPDMGSYGPIPEIYAPVMQKSLSQSSHTSVSSSVYSRTGPAGSSNIIQSPSSFRPPSMGSLQGSIASSTTHQRTQPKVSSPLVRALTGFGR